MILDTKTKLHISTLTDALVSNPEHGLKVWREDTSLSDSLRTEVCHIVGNPSNLKSRLVEVIERLEASASADVKTTGRILRWSATNFGAIPSPKM